jgi:hypothetical protein
MMTQMGYPTTKKVSEDEWYKKYPYFDEPVYYDQKGNSVYNRLGTLDLTKVEYMGTERKYMCRGRVVYTEYIDWYTKRPEYYGKKSE